MAASTTVELEPLEDVKNNSSVLKPRDKKFTLGVRHLQVLLNFLLVFLAYGIRVNLNVGIVAMTTPNSSSNPDIPVYESWDQNSVVLSSFFWGYIFPQIGAGQLAKRYGPKWFLVGMMSVCASLNAAIPIAAELLGENGVMGARIVQGFAQGFIFPSVHHMLSNWVPLEERSRLGTFVYTGGSLGTVVSTLVSGQISASRWGWPGVFYVYSILGIFWVLLMAYYGADSPEDYKGISSEELLYIEGSKRSSNKKTMPTPWLKMVTSIPVWALLVVHCGQNWGFWTLMTEMPTYMNRVLGYDMRSNSLYSALPYLALWVLSFIFGPMGDYLIVKKYASVGTTRKIENSIGLYLPAVSLIALGYVPLELRAVAVVLLVAAVGLNSGTYCGYNVNHMDLSPNHAATMMGITNCLSNICSLLGPLFVHFIVSDQDDILQWRVVFYVSASIWIVTNTVFVIFGSGEVQSWNDEESSDQKPSGNGVMNETNPLNGKVQ